MENIDSVWQVSIIAMVAGVLIGALAYRLLGGSAKETDKIKTELDTAREELESYKASVNQHFNKTSELVNDLTQNYVKVHQHLAEGAYTLGDSKTFTNLLEQPESSAPIDVSDEVKSSADVVDEPIVEPAEAQVVSQERVDEVVEDGGVNTGMEGQSEADTRLQEEPDSLENEEDVEIKNASTPKPG